MAYWCFIKSQINCNDNLFTFGRTKEVQEKYIAFRSKIPNIYDYLMRNLFSKNENLVFKENDFPYKFDGNIGHYVIWLNPNCNKKINKRQINKFLSSNILKLNLNILDYIIFKNNPINKSVETIEHYHVLLRLN